MHIFSNNTNSSHISGQILSYFVFPDSDVIFPDTDVIFPDYSVIFTDNNVTFPDSSNITDFSISDMNDIYKQVILV